MPKASWNGTVVADSDKCKVVEGNYYFPPEAVNSEYLVKSPTTSVCSWKGTASYYHLNVNGAVNNDAAWYYPDPKDAAKDIAGYIAFWRGVSVSPN
jgi:uncharacterized protein (DUF427 family)